MLHYHYAAELPPEDRVSDHASTLPIGDTGSRLAWRNWYATPLRTRTPTSQPARDTRATRSRRPAFGARRRVADHRPSGGLLVSNHQPSFGLESSVAAGRR